MPIWLRRFTFNEIQKFYKEESDAVESAKNGGNGQKTLIDPSGKVNTPEFLQASKQHKKPAKYK